MAGDLTAAIAPYQQALTAALTAATQLPLVGNQLNRLSEFTTALQNAEDSIRGQTESITANGHHQVVVSLPTLSKSFAFNLGLDAFLKATAVGNVSATIQPKLTLAFDLAGGVASLDVDQSRFDIGFGLSLPGFQGTFSLNGLLFTKAVDAGTSFNGSLGFKFAGADAVTPQFSGTANVRMGLSMSFADPALNPSFNPTFRATLDMGWGFGADNQLAAPRVALANMGLEADGFLRGFLGDVVTTAQKFTKPIQPFIDIFQTPVPILSAFDSGETFGNLMLRGAGVSAEQQDRFKTMVQVINAVNTIDLSGGAGGAIIPFGSVGVTGDPRLAGAFGFDTSGLTNAIDAIFRVPELKDVEGALRKVANYAGINAAAGFQFPLLEDPGAVVGGILTGRPDTTLFSFTTGRQHFELAPSIGVGIPGVLGIFLDAGIMFDANLSMGYDAAGLLAFSQNPNNIGKLLHGFYFDNAVDETIPTAPGGQAIRKTGLYLKGLMEAKADALLAHVSGGLYANVIVELVNADASSRVRLDTMIGNLIGGGKVFKLGGKLYASADVSLGLELPVGPDITLYSFNLAYEELLNFDPVPPPSGVPITVIDVVGQHALALDVAKMGAGSVVTVQPFFDTAVSAGGNTFEASGIRVDYPGEIHLYVERKNGATTNYYNLVTLDGPAPDGATVIVTDPFRVFADQGVADPGPAGTRPAVLLAGGKNVSYTYNEAADGTRAHVLLIGGAGSNTLSGGTMMFGNFIPADRVVQAKGHLTSAFGLDPSGLALIHARIDAAIAPADPAGVIGSKMTGSRGGLMMGGAGSNSFIATGAGVYEMIGGAWINSFNISPAFSGGPSTYQIDGGSFGQASLVVRAPFDQMVDFENGSAPDKYHPEFKALDIFGNSGLFATAHGINSVLVIGSPGSTIVFGDTSEVDVALKARGSGTLKFAGTDAADAFDVGSQYDTYYRDNYRDQYSGPYSGVEDGIYGTRDFRAPMRFIEWNTFPFDPLTARVVAYDPKSLVYTRESDGTYNGHPYHFNGFTWDAPVYPERPYLYAVPWEGTWYNNLAYWTGTPGNLVPHDLGPAFDPAPYLSYRFDNPLYVVARTFGTNGRSQSITFEMHDVAASSIILDGRGGADDYHIDVGLGSFLDIRIEDSDASTSNSLRVDFNQTELLPRQATLSDDSIQLEYYTPSFHLLSFSYNIYNLVQAVKYAPTISFSPNMDVNLTSAVPFKHAIIDRPTSERSASIVVTGFYPPPVGSGRKFSLYIPELAGDAESTGRVYQDYHGIGEIDVRANAGNLSIKTVELDYFRSFFETRLNFRVHSNTGAITIDAPKTTWTAAFLDIASGDNRGVITVDTAKVGLRMTTFSLLEGDSVETEPVAMLKSGSVVIDGLPPGLRFDPSTGRILGVVDLGAAQDSPYRVMIRAVSTIGDPPSTVETTSATFEIRVSSVALVRPPLQLGRGGDSVHLQIQALSPGGALLEFAAEGLPDGLSIDPTTGIISGVIAEPWGPMTRLVTVSATRGGTVATASFPWSVLPAGLSDVVTLANPGRQSSREGAAASLVAFGASSLGLPLVYAIEGLPPGLTLDPESGRISGAIQGGAAGASPYRVTITVTDGRWSEQVAFDWFVTVSAVNDPPAVDLGPDAEVAHGGAFARSGSFSAEGDGPWTATVDYGDGNGAVALALNSDKTFLLSHTFGSPGVYAVTVVISDGQGGEGRQSISVTVAAAPVDPRPVDPRPVDPSPVDPSPVDPPPVVNPPVDPPPPPVVGPPASGFGAGPDAFVRALFRLNLGREPRPEDLRHWSGLLARGRRPMVVVGAIWFSREHRAAVREGLVPRLSLRASYNKAIRAWSQAAPPEGSRPSWTGRLRFPGVGGPSSARGMRG